MMLMMLLIPCLLVALLVVAIALGSGLVAPSLHSLISPAPGARDVLDRRYAQGEISKAQYDQMLADIAD